MNKDSTLLLLLKNILEIKQQLHDLNNNVAALKVPFWDKLWTGSFPALLGALGGGLITVLIFYLTKRKEDKRRIEDIEKEKDDKVVSLYAEAIGLKQAIVNCMGSLNYHQLQREYFSIVSQRKDNPDPETAEQLHKNEQEKYIIYFDKFSDHFMRLASICAELSATRNDKAILKKLDEFGALDFQKSGKMKLNNQLEFTQLQGQVQQYVNDCTEYARTVIAPKINELIQLIR